MRKMLAVLVPAVVLTACGYVSEYEKGVYDFEPIYCYRYLGGVQCHDTPNHRDERRLVNYYGPAPVRYDRPDPPPDPELYPPSPVNYFVKDPEPIPRPAPRAPFGDRPWLKGDASFGMPAAPPPAPVAAAPAPIVDATPTAVPVPEDETLTDDDDQP